MYGESHLTNLDQETQLSKHIAYVALSELCRSSTAARRPSMVERVQYFTQEDCDRMFEENKKKLLQIEIEERRKELKAAQEEVSAKKRKVVAESKKRISGTFRQAW